MSLETIASPPSRATSQETLWMDVDLGRIVTNLEQLRLKIRPFTRVMAVIKANAYGHGLAPVAKALQGKVDFLGLGSLKEASLIREQGITTPLFLFGRLFSDQIPLALQMNLVLTVSSLEEAKEISEIAGRFAKEVTVHVKVDTGMGRLGIPYPQAFGEIEKIAGLPGIRLDGIYTHFPAEERYPDPLGEKQLKDFETLIQNLRRKGISFSLRHAANSAGALRLKSPHLNLVRPGLALYGIYPDRNLESEIKLEPALSLKTRVVFLKTIQAGESVGYGREFVASQSTTVAVLPVGYAHGIPFQISGKGEVLCRRRRFRFAGRVCMDSLMVDLGSFREARVGDEVILIGETEGMSLRTEEIARTAKTIPYEIVTRLDPGVPRFYQNLQPAIL